MPEQSQHRQISVSVKSKNCVARSPYFASGTCIGDSWGFADKSKTDILVSCIRSNRVKRDVHFVPSRSQLAIADAPRSKSSKRRSRSKSRHRRTVSWQLRDQHPATDFQGYNLGNILSGFIRTANWAEKSLDLKLFASDHDPDVTSLSKYGFPYPIGTNMAV